MAEEKNKAAPLPALGRAALLAAAPRLHRVDVPEYGGSVGFRSLTGDEQLAFEAAVGKRRAVARAPFMDAKPRPPAAEKPEGKKPEAAEEPPMTQAELAALTAADSEVNYWAMCHLVAMTAVDDGGTRLFEDADETALRALPSAILMRLFEGAQKASGILAEDIEGLAKN